MRLAGRPARTASGSRTGSASPSISKCPPASSIGLITLQVVQRNLAAIGITMNIRGVEFNELFATLNGNGHDWDSIVLAWTIETYPDQQQFFSSDGTANYGHYDRPQDGRG